MEIATENQDVPMFELADNEAYAETDTRVWQAMRFFNQLEVVDPKELAPEDRTCSICKLPYDDSTDGNSTHIPVRLPCLHVFGKVCLAEWITPLGAWENNGNSEWEELHEWFENQVVNFSGSASCPLCRIDLFRKPRMAESAMGLEARLIFWDRAYEKIGCLRSEKEEQSRADMIQYMEFNRIANGDNTGEKKTAIDRRWNELERYHRAAKTRLYCFIIRRKRETAMTPTQARLHRNLEHISLSGLDIIVDDPMFVQFKADGDRWSLQWGRLVNNVTEDVDMLDVATGDVDTGDVDTENHDMFEVD
ncbi:hypothetical protein MMC22_004575 [Lobaria immixta]|nr:hypothetical protein [Lobaria immixta]